MRVRTGAQGAKEFLHYPARILAAIFASSLVLSGVHAQGNSTSHESQRAVQVRALNNSVLQLQGQVQENVASAGGLREHAAQVLAQRAAALEALIQENPRAALSFAFSPELLADLAEKFPEATSLLESHVTLSGTVEHWIADFPNTKSSKETWFLSSGGIKLSLHFATSRVPNSTASTVAVEGVRIGSAVAVSSFSQAGTPSGAKASALAANYFNRGSLSAVLVLGFAGLILLAIFTALERRRHEFARAFNRRLAAVAVAVVFCSNAPAVSAQATCSTTGVQNVAVLMVTFPGVSLPAGVSQASLQDIFFGSNTPGPSLDGFLREASYGQTSATGAVFGTYTLTGTYTSCGDVGGAVTNDAVAAAIAGGVNLNSYSRVFIVFPDIFGCQWAGFAAVGTCSFATPSGTFNASMAYFSADYAVNRASGVGVASHELGHNMGLLHSGTIAPTTASDVLGPVTSPGTEADTGDYWSTLGEPVLGLYPAPQKAEVLKWLAPTTNYQVVQSNGTYTLQSLETSPAGVQVLKVQRGSGNNAWLWIEYRQPTGNYDSTLLGPEAFAGALIHYEDGNTPLGHTYLTNFTPADTTGNSPALAAGQTWNDPYSNVSVSTLSATSTGLTVSVSYNGGGGSACTGAAPSIVASPLNPSIYAGQTANYAISVTNNDSSSCGSSTINLSSSAPTGWSTNFSTPSVTLSPGQSANVTMGKGAPTGTPAGTYAVDLSANHNSTNATDTANATVLTAPSLAVTASVAGSSFTRPSTVPLSASVTNGGAAAAGASVTFAVAAPNGSTSAQTATTGSNGIATISYKLSNRSLSGTYSVTAKASVTSGSKKNALTQTAVSNVVSFVVQ